MSKLLDISNLSLSIHGKPVLHEICLSIQTGEKLGVIGESGSGKSLTALSVMQLLPQGSQACGQLLFEGADLLAMPEPELCALRGNDIGMVFQEPMTALNPLQRVGDQVAECVRLHTSASRREARLQAAELLEHCGLPPTRYPVSRYPHELSGGQRQRVVIAMAVAMHPRLLIADEPTTALDVTTQAGILQLLDRLVIEQGMGLMLISHDLAVVAGMADHIAVMRSGQVLDTDTTDALFAQRRHPYTRALYAASTHAPPRMSPGQQDRAGEPLLQVQSLACYYRLPRQSPFGARPRMQALHDVALTIHSGESVALVGESGCGKSTLTRALLGLEKEVSGQITLQGVALAAGAVELRSRRQMQVVFQDPYGSFNPRRKVEWLVAEPLHLLTERLSDGARKARVVVALESVGLQARDAERYIHEFSGGQRQRIAIARALIVEPALIILDEAVSALDVSVRAQVLDLLAELATTRALAYLFISHDLSVVRHVSDRVLVMQQGRIVEQGPTDSLFQNPQHPCTRALLNAAPRLPGHERDW